MSMFIATASSQMWQKKKIQSVLSFSCWNGTQNRWLLRSLIHGVKKREKKKQSLLSITKAVSPNMRCISHPALAASSLSLLPSPLRLFQAHSVNVAKITRATFWLAPAAWPLFKAGGAETMPAYIDKWPSIFTLFLKIPVHE